MEESTACAEKFIAGIVTSYSWEVKHSRAIGGMLELEIAKAR